MTTLDANTFLRRDWEKLRAHKERAWAAIKAERGVDAAVLAAESLRLAARAHAPGWPGEAARRSDLETHIRVARALRSVPV